MYALISRQGLFFPLVGEKGPEASGKCCKKVESMRKNNTGKGSLKVGLRYDIAVTNSGDGGSGPANVVQRAVDVRLQVRH